MDAAGAKPFVLGRAIQEKPETVRQIQAETDQADLERTLVNLMEKALNAGAANATVIDAAALSLNPNHTKKIKEDNGYPSVHWPANYTNDDIAEAFKAYRKGILFRVDAPPGMPEYGGGPVPDPDHRQALHRVYEITTLLESNSFYLGYHLCLGFAVGNCRAVFCHDEKRCWAMVKGRCCIWPYRARPSMIAVGVDAEAMARRVGWSWQGPLLAGLVMID